MRKNVIKTTTTINTMTPITTPAMAALVSTQSELSPHGLFPLHVRESSMHKPFKQVYS